MKILVLGVGNILFGDEGIGVHLTYLLKQDYAFTSSDHSLDIIDGGTGANTLIPLITDYDKVIILDAIDAIDAKIGDIYSFNFKNIPNAISWSGTAHEVEMIQTLKMIEVFGDLGDIHIIGVIPQIIGSDPTFTLSEAVLNSSTTMISECIKLLEKEGFKITKINNSSLQELAQHSYKY